VPKMASVITSTTMFVSTMSTAREIVNTCGWDRGALPSILLSDHLARVVF
jgi:hypothetical protein